MSKKTPRKLSLKDKDIPAGQAKKVMGGDCASGATAKGKAQPQPFVFVHTFDKASPVL